MALKGYTLSLEDPQAPSLEQWEAMTERERRDVVASLPSEIPRSGVPEGDLHFHPKVQTVDALREWFRRKGRAIYLASELPVYYPAERLVAPDVMAVLDAAVHPRNTWNVAAEGKGLDFALEVLVSGDAKKDREDNVVRYARLKIPEYFIWEPVKNRLTGYRLVAGKPGVYEPIIPQQGRWASGVLGLELGSELGRLRFYSGTAPLPDAQELIGRLDEMVTSLTDRELQLAREVEEERQQKERLAQKLRELGVDPDKL